MLHEQKNVLLLSSDPSRLQQLRQYLKAMVQCVPLREEQEAVRYLELNEAHLLIVDAKLPKTPVRTVVDTFHSEKPGLPVILVAQADDPELSQYAADHRYSQVLVPPLVEGMVQNAVRTQLESAELREQNDLLVEERTAELQRERDLLIWLFANLAEYRDQEQGSHIQRTQACVHRLIQGYNQLFPERAVPPKLTADIELGSQLHDIGKIAIPETILLKPGRLTPEEFDVMKRHTLLGSRALQNPFPGDPPTFLAVAQEIALNHHEKWDGTGYPQGLRGEQIPLSARIVAVVDVLDALMSLRPYRNPLTFDQATQSIVEGRGAHFDPDLVDAFLNQRALIEEVYVGYQDP